MNLGLTYIASLILPLVVGEINPETQAAQNLVDSILGLSYDTRVRPRGDDSVTEIAMRLNLLAINDLNAVSETLDTTAWVHIGWFDSRLEWDNGTFPDKPLTVPQDSVWKPDVSLKNSYSDIRALGNKYTYVTIGMNGLLSWYPYQVFQSNCDLDVSHFPFDEQTCSLEFSAWSFIAEQVKFVYTEISLKGYQSSNSFDLINHSSKETIVDASSVATFTFHLKRKPFFIVMTTVCPIIILALLGLCVFLLSFDSGEKVSYTVTVFLAFIVTLTYVSTILPENSDSLSYLAVYVTSQVVLSTLHTFITIVLCTWYNFDENVTPVPKCLVFLARLCNRKRGGCRNCSWQCAEETRRKYELSTDMHQSPNISSASTVHPKRELPSGVDTNNTAKEEHPGQHVTVDKTCSTASQSANVEGETHSIHPSTDSKQDTNPTWKSVVNCLDIFCFVFFLLVFLLCTGLYIGASITGI